MGLVNSALQIGRSALQSYQSALQVVGNNIANAGNEDYTRQVSGLSAAAGTPLPEGFQPGAGVAMTQLKRNLDEALENRLRTAIGQIEMSQVEQQTLVQVETQFDENSGAAISGRLYDFFNSFSDIQNAPAELATRDVVLANGQTLADAVQNLRGQLRSLSDQLDEQIDELVTEADSLSAHVAELNQQIATAEAGSTGAAYALRDQRDGLLRDLSELIDVSVHEQPDGSINVYAGSELLILGNHSRGLTTEFGVEDGTSRTDIRFADSGALVPVRGGRLYGLMASRDQHAIGQIEALDELAAAIIFEVNRFHSEGQGLEGFDSVEGTYAVNDVNAALNSAEAGLAFVPSNGSFYIAVADEATGATVAHQIDVDLDGIGDNDTSLASLAADINTNVDGVTARITPNNRLQITADEGFAFTFGHDGQQFRADTANVLAALGINTFFTGVSAADIAVNETVRNSSQLLAASMANFPGDGSNAGRLSQVADIGSDQLGGRTLLDGYQHIATEVATTSARARDQLEARQAALSSLQAQKESISGVSLDEEAVEMLRFERAFQGAARYVSVVDQLMAEMLSLVR